MSEKKIYKLPPQKPVSFLIAGIVSHEKIFILSNELNNFTELKLEELVSVTAMQNDITKTFNAYRTLPDESGKIVSLISNRCSDGILFDAYKNLDYFIIWSSENTIIAEHLPLKNIKESKLVLGISLLTINSDKEKKSFLEVINQLRH